MKLSETKEILELLLKAGLPKDISNMTPAELEELSKDSTFKETLLKQFSHGNRNIYQELEMDSPYVNTHRDISYTPEKLQLHSHSFYEVLYCESGDIQYLIADKRYRIHAGDIILVPPGVSHRPLFYEEMAEPYSRIVLWVSTEFIHAIAKLYPEEQLAQAKLRDHYLLRTEGSPYKSLGEAFRRGLQEANHMAPLWEVALYGNTAALLAQLSRALMSTHHEFPAEQREDLDRIITYIEKHYAEKITLEDTAKAFHISTSTLGKMFSDKLGISFYHFVTQRRLINSKLKIEEDSSMEEAALACGFCDYSAFYRAFKKEYGISPREYKKLVSRNIEL